MSPNSTIWYLTRAVIRGVHWEWGFTIPVSAAGILQEWDWTQCNLGMGFGITTRERDGMGIDNCGKIPAQQQFQS